MSNVHRLRLTDRIFFVNVNLRPRIGRFNESEYALLIDVLEASRRRLGFLLCGYVLMPDHGHALVWPHPASLRSGRKVVAHGATCPDVFDREPWEQAVPMRRQPRKGRKKSPPEATAQ